MICPTCQFENIHEFQHCENCGVQISNVSGTVAERSVLAGRSRRLFAAIIDLILVFVALFLGKLVLGPLTPALFLAILIVQVILLTKDGQTIGKKALKIWIIDRDTGRVGGFTNNVLLRLGVNGALGVIPFYSLVDVLFIFRKNRRCIHDFIAGTQVVEA